MPEGQGTLCQIVAARHRVNPSRRAPPSIFNVTDPSAGAPFPPYGLGEDPSHSCQLKEIENRFSNAQNTDAERYTVREV